MEDFCKACVVMEEEVVVCIRVIVKTDEVIIDVIIAERVVDWVERTVVVP